jgi:hypothetical protein
MNHDDTRVTKNTDPDAGIRVMVASVVPFVV